MKDSSTGGCQERSVKTPIVDEVLNQIYWHPLSQSLMDEDLVIHSQGYRYLRAVGTEIIWCPVPSKNGSQIQELVAGNGCENCVLVAARARCRVRRAKAADAYALTLT